jgi:hypothetical protein
MSEERQNSRLKGPRIFIIAQSLLPDAELCQTWILMPIGYSRKGSARLGKVVRNCLNCARLRPMADIYLHGRFKRNTGFLNVNRDVAAVSLVLPWDCRKQRETRAVDDADVSSCAF